jgi:hypothetical protein
MMKKLLVLMLVLGVASMANAGLMLKFNGEDVEQVNYTTTPAGVLSVDWTGSLMGFTIAIETQGATIDLSSATWGGGWQLPPYWDATVTTETYVKGGGGNLFGAQSGPASVVNGINLSLFGAGKISLIAADTILLSGATDSIAAGTVLDTITIVPEPMSLMLLGLGGLFLRRRK